MKRIHPVSQYRNIGIIAHIDSGKTTVSERILFYTGKTHKIGEVHNGNTTLDYLPQERERGITITSAATTCFWSGSEEQYKEHRINLIDTPGHIDFSIEVQRSLRVLDGTVSVFCAVAGVQPQSETVWKQANDYNVPRIAFVNKMDRVGANFFNVAAEIESRLHSKTVMLTLPIGSEENFKGIIDVLGKKKIIWEGEESAILNLDEEELRKVEDLFENYSEVAAEANEELMEKFINGEKFTVEEMKFALRKLTIENKIVPILCGSAFKNKGVQFLLDCIIDYLPSPLDVAPQVGHLEEQEVQLSVDDKKPFVGLVFKVITDKHLGQVSFVRIYQGALESGSEIFIPSKGKNAHIGRIVEMHANQQTPRDNVFSGDIAAFIGLDNITTGTTLTDKSFQIVLESINIMPPVVFAAIEADSDTEQKKLSAALNKVTLEDPSITLKVNEETGQTIVGGRGELHLEVMVDMLKTQHGVNVKLGKPEVAFREAITKSVEIEGKYIKQTGGKGHHGHVWIRFTPLPLGSGIVFKNELKGGVVPVQYLSAVEQGINNAANKGILDGYPLTDFEATIFDGSTHRVDSAELDFKLAAEDAVKKLSHLGNPILLEPIMNVEVDCPEENLGTVIGIVSSLKGSITATEDVKGYKVVKAEVPLQNLFGFTSTLRSNTQGRARGTMEFSKYAKLNQVNNLKMKI